MSRWLWTAELWTPVAASARQYIRRRKALLTDRFQERLQFLGPRRVAQLAERLRFDLADSFACHVEGAPDFLEGVLRAVADTEAHLQDLLFPRGQGLQHAPRLVLEVRDQDRLDRREDPPG